LIKLHLVGYRYLHVMKCYKVVWVTNSDLTTSTSYLPGWHRAGVLSLLCLYRVRISAKSIRDVSNCFLCTYTVTGFIQRWGDYCDAELAG